MNKKKAIVLGGGGSLGAYQVGCFKYLHEIGYEYDIVYGTSIGSVNGRMTCSIKLNAVLNKGLIELGRKVKDILGIK